MSEQTRISRRRLLGTAAALGSAALAGTTPPVLAAPRARQADRPTAQLPARGALVVRGAYVLTMDPAHGDLPVGDVHVRGGEIVAVGTDLAAPGAEVLDGRDMIALPGFVDTHWHLWNSSLRALVRGGDPAYSYFPVTLRLGPFCTPEDAYRAVRLGLADGLSAGITTVHDWSHNVRGPEYADAELSALRDMGVRARFAYGWGQDYPTDRPMNSADVARVQREWLARPSEGLLTLGIASRNVVSGQSLRGSIALELARRDWDAARELGLPITLHASPAGLVTTLEEARLLGPDVQLVHPLATTAEEREILAARGTSYSTSPQTEVRYAQARGVIQLAELFDAGVQASLSLDTTAAPGNGDFFNSLRLLASSHEHRFGEQRPLDPRRLLELATIDGARDLGLADQVGSLTPGKRADLILVRTTDPNLAPVVDPVHALVYAAQPANVDTVVVDGRILRRGGQFTALDVEQVVREAAESVAAVRARRLAVRRRE